MTKVVKVRDFSFKPGKLTVPRRSTIVWKWPSTAGSAPHNVTLTRRPGVKCSARRPCFHSATKYSRYTFKRKLTVKGKYVVVCTLHRAIMRETIVVK